MESHSLTRDQTPGLLRWQRRISATGPPGKPQAPFLRGPAVAWQVCSRALPESPVLSILSCAPRPHWPSGSLADASSRCCPQVAALCLPLLSTTFGPAFGGGARVVLFSLTHSPLWAVLRPLARHGFHLSALW